MGIRHLWYTVPLRLRSLFRRRQVEQELAEELQFHLEHAIAEGVAKGLSPREARRRAMLAMGGPELRREEIRDARRLNGLLELAADLRFAGRSLRRSPGVALLVVATLALGIGMTAPPMSMVDALVLRPYPVPDPGRVVNLVSTTPDEPNGSFSYREYVDLRQQTRSYAGVVATTPLRSMAFAPDAKATPRIAGGVLVSGNWFAALGVEPALGRAFGPAEDAVPGRDAVVVLSHLFWERELASDPGIVGRTVRLNGSDFTVLGVAPESFPGMQVFSRPDLYVPLAMASRFASGAERGFFEDRSARELRLMGRLRPGVSVDTARGELARVAADLAREAPAHERRRGAAVRTAFEMRTRGDDKNWKFGVVFLLLAVAVLLVACTNVAAILLSRARTRTREIAVRLALGAGRSRLVRLLLAESFLLALAGGVGGVAVGYAGISWLQRFSIPAELPVTIPFRMDHRVIGASLAVALASAVFCGLAPALQSTRRDLVTGLKSADVEVPGRKRLWGRSALVVVQVAMSSLLLAGSFVLARSFQADVLGGVGFRRENLLLVRFDPRLVQYDSPATRAFYDTLVERVAALPGVVGAGLTGNPPLSLDRFGALSLVPEGYQMPPDRETLAAATDTVDEGFFTTFGIPLVAGRGFTAADSAESPRVAVVNQHLAELYWPGQQAVGRRLWLDGDRSRAVEVVGVAQTVSYRSPGDPPTPFVYLPLAQAPQPRMVLAVRTSGDPVALVAPLRQLVRTLDPNLPLLDTRTAEDLYRYHAVEGPGTAIELSTTLGMVGLAITLAGLYGLVAYNVGRRTREIGIRMAVGAAPARIFRLVVRGGATLVLVGAGIGLVLALALERLMDSAIFETAGVDLVAYLTVVPSLVAVALLAALVPARRAARMPPTLALRVE